jgi:two-component system chemotaxis response regulator CheB
MKKARVLIVDESLVIQTLLENIIGGDPRLEVAAVAGSGEEALRVLGRISPDVISMDIRLPGMNGVEATRRIMSEKPTPIVVIAAGAESHGLSSVSALAAGALTVLEKPLGPASAHYEALAERFCTQLAIMSQVKVVRGRPISPATFSEWPLVKPHGNFRAIGIVSSTGGPNALAQLLPALGRDFPLPILLVQHISSGFLTGFAKWLQGVSPFYVKMVEKREALTRGAVYLAAPGCHLRLVSDFLEADIGHPVSLQRPAGTLLFESMAKSLGGQALGALLTGMGDDGAAGLLKIREAGGYTIAEDESTAVVYGMPAEAVRLGGVCESLPLPAIGPRILELVAPRRPTVLSNKRPLVLPRAP